MNNTHFVKPNILDEIDVLDMRKEFLSAFCKFNGTCDLNLFPNYINWLAHTINETHKNNRYTFLIKQNSALLGALEITINPITPTAHAILCLRPSVRRKGYSKPLGKQALYECALYGVKKDHVTLEFNCKSARHTINF